VPSASVTEALAQRPTMRPPIVPSSGDDIRAAKIGPSMKTRFFTDDFFSLSACRSLGVGSLDGLY
jgi:hypothetical protein